jgi:hypothetical protein
LLDLSARFKLCQGELEELRAEKDRLRLELDALNSRSRPAEFAASRAECSISGCGCVAVRLDRFASLRALVIKTLHPDKSPLSSPLEKTIRAELFKVIWPEILKIEGDT